MKVSVVTPHRAHTSRAPETAEDRTISDLAAVVFCSALQPSEAPGWKAVRATVGESLSRHHDALTQCAAELADCYGDDPDGACQRMRWARETVITTYFAGLVAA